MEVVDFDSEQFTGNCSIRFYFSFQKNKTVGTVAIEVGLQNAGLASELANAMEKLATVGLSPALFSPIMNVTGPLLASWWSKKKVE